MYEHGKVFIPDRKEYSGFIIRAKSMGLTTEKIIEICRTQPNFDEETDPKDIAGIIPRPDVDQQVAVAFKKLLDYGYEPPDKQDKVKKTDEKEEETPPANHFDFNVVNFHKLEAIDTTNDYFVPKKITALFADAGVGKPVCICIGSPKQVGQVKRSGS